MSNNHEYPQIYLLQQLFQVLESASTGIDGEINVNDFIIPTNIDNPNRNGPNPDSTGTYTVEQVRTNCLLYFILEFLLTLLLFTTDATLQSTHKIRSCHLY